MNITPQATNLSIPTVLNPHTETLRRENNQREIISQPAALNQSAAEKGVASDKERGRTPAQNNESIDFASLKEKAELANNAISEQNKEQNKEQNSDQKASQDKQQESDNGTDAASNQENIDNHAEELQQAREISELQRRDQEVRSHELAHASVGGAFTGSPNYSFETGPNGKKYAVAGEVSVDLSSIQGDPKATIEKMQKVHAAALAPAHPSVQDTRVAASAAQIILQAQSELIAEQGNEFTGEKLKNAAHVPSQSSLAQGREATADEASNESDFDTFINQTLKAQESIASERSDEVVQRAGRIESFYSKITQAYEKPATYQFELTA